MKRLLIFFSLWSSASCCFAEDWPQFRGPEGNGHYKGEKLPTAWGQKEKPAWVVDISGKGWSSPVIFAGKIYLTTAVEKGKDLDLQVIALDAKTGQTFWNLSVNQFELAKLPKIHNKNSHASPTPVVTADRLYVHFGHMGTYAIDLTKKSPTLLWKKTDLYSKPVHGNGGSPILYKDKLIFSCDGLDKQAVIALNVKDGSVAWEVSRGLKASRPFSFSTPHIHQDAQGAVVFSAGSGVFMAINPDTGKEIWRMTYPEGYSIIPRPVVGHGMVYFGTSYDSPVLHAVKLGGSGDVTSSNDVWTAKKGVPHTASFLLVGDELYTVSDGGIFTCYDAKTGKVHYSERVAGNYSASPLFWNGKIYLTNETGTGTLLEAGKEFKKLDQFEMKEATLASPVAADGALYIRTDKKLYKYQAK